MTKSCHHEARYDNLQTFSQGAPGTLAKALARRCPMASCIMTILATCLWPLTAASSCPVTDSQQLFDDSAVCRANLPCPDHLQPASILSTHESFPTNQTILLSLFPEIRKIPDHTIYICCHQYYHHLKLFLDIRSTPSSYAAIQYGLEF